MLDSLSDLNDSLQKRGSQLELLYGKAEEVVEKLIQSQKIDAIFFNEDYTPFSRKRDRATCNIASKYNVIVENYFDLLLSKPGTVLTGKNTPYTVYSHFYKKASSIDVPRPRNNKLSNFSKKQLSLKESTSIEKVRQKIKPNEHLYSRGGRKEALKILNKISDYKNYDEQRNIPALGATTELSPHQKFGTVSIREVYHRICDTFSKNHSLIGELYWRDFFTQVAFHFPYVFGGCFHKKYDALEWGNNKKKFKAWCDGTTGFPIVDAGMRQLNLTGFMHNRVRMIVASFLVKDLHIDWRWGEKYFAQQLVDYDPAVNNGNWQWAASTGCDAQPYFRIFNPWLQQKKFDPECVYIKRWIKELNMFSPKEIHALSNGNPLLGYPAPIVEHSEARQIAEDIFLDVK